MLTTTTTLPLPSPAPAVAPVRPPSVVGCASAVCRRTLLRALRSPRAFTTGLVRGAMFLLIFRYVFGGALTSGLDYVQFLVPGFVAVSALFSGMSSATSVAEDVAEGFTDRLRSLPAPRVGLLTGRVLADTALCGVGLAVTAAVGVAIGFRPSGSLLGVVGAGGLCLLAAFAVTWVFVTLGLVARSVQAAQGMAMLVFPFTFVSSAFVPVDSMPGWMQAFAEHQPVTYLASATRSLALGADAEATLGQPAAYFVIRALLWLALITVTFAPLAIRRYGRS